MSQTHSLTGRLAILAISPLFVDRFGRSLLFCHLEFDEEAMYDDLRSEKAALLWSYKQYNYLIYKFYIRVNLFCYSCDTLFNENKFIEKLVSCRF